jgi:hypothetical protein
MIRMFPVTEQTNVQFRAEIFNLFNTPPLGFPGTVLTSPTAGRILSAGPSRQVQFALRFSF